MRSSFDTSKTVQMIPFGKIVNHLMKTGQVFFFKKKERYLSSIKGIFLERRRHGHRTLHCRHEANGSLEQRFEKEIEKFWGLQKDE